MYEEALATVASSLCSVSATLLSIVSMDDFNIATDDFEAEYWASHDRSSRVLGAVRVHGRRKGTARYKEGASSLDDPRGKGNRHRPRADETKESGCWMN